MRVYEGTILGARTTADTHLVTVTETGRSRPLPHYSHHSNDWSWGYEGSGVAALAYDILCDYDRIQPTLDQIYAGTPRVQAVYQDFKRRFLAPIPQHSNLRITEAEISAWLAEPAQMLRLAEHEAYWTDLLDGE